MAAHSRISIVTPCFNHAPFIEQTPQSVLDQAYPQLEYVVIDGGSTDGSRERSASHMDECHAEMRRAIELM